jgi:predicted glycosyltransferase
MNPNLSSHPRILLHCQYVYGIGHLVRAVELARGLSARFQVFILNGGETVPNFELPETVKFIQLPAIYKEEKSEHLSPVDTSITLNECFLSREKIIKKSVEEIKPDLLITEHFPFGLFFEAEVMDLIKKVKNVNSKAKIVTSVRDLIESGEGGKRDAYICDLINNWYDMVLVHGDEKFAALSKSFPQINKIKVQIFHTGYIVRPIPIGTKNGNFPVILASVAGGRLGNELLDAIIDSHLNIRARKNHKLILFSGAFERDFKKQKEKVSSLQSEDVKIYMFDSQKYVECLSNATLVITLGGYNSIIESVSAKKAILVYQRGFAGGNEEQDLRIKLFENTGHLKIIKPEDLNAEKLSDLIINRINELDVPEFELNMNGVQNSGLCLHNLLSI